MATSFPFPPDDPDGNWIVRLPADACIGEVLVYAEGDAGELLLRWKCDESDFPVLEVNGFDHTLTELGGVGAIATFGLASMRDDSGGSAIGHSFEFMDASWAPPIASSDGWYALAGLMQHYADGGGAEFMSMELTEICSIDLHSTSGLEQPARFGLWNGTAMSFESTYAGTATGGAQFMAIRVSPDGDWTRWVGDETDSGSFGSYDPASTDGTTILRVLSNDPNSHKFQELHVWLREASDAEIEAVRLDLVGV